MARNVEIKAKVNDVRCLLELIEKLPVESHETLNQEDTFFETGPGRLKLRRLGKDRGQIIRYHRNDEKGPKMSDYSIEETKYPDDALRFLSEDHRIKGVVKKRREVYIVGRTRIHVDEVEGLGNFVEFEYVLDEGQDIRDGKEAINTLMSSLGINEQDLVECAYIDLL